MAPYFTTSAITAALIAVILWLLRNWIRARLTESIKHEYNEKLEGLRSELRNSEEEFRTGLRARESEFDMLRSGALTNMTTRQSVLAKRRLEAVDKVWAAAIDDERFKFLVDAVQMINIDGITKASPNDAPKLKEFFRTITQNISDIERVGGEAAKERPYISDLAWAYFNAYTSIIVHAVGTAKILELGEDPRKFIDEKGMMKVVKAALPDWEEYIEKWGFRGAPHLAEELKTRLMVELRNVLTNKVEDKEEIKRAAKILEAAKEVQQNIDRAKASNMGLV